MNDSRISIDSWRGLLCLFFLAPLLYTSAVQAEQVTKGSISYFIEPVAHWIVPSSKTDPEQTPTEGGVGYRLINRQIHFDGKKSHSYRHLILRVNNRSGLNEASEKTIQFDPAFERLVFHKMTIHRGEQRIDALKTARIETSQSENSFNQSMLEGKAQVLIVLRDIRVGDHIEYAYTVEGSNPVFNGGFSVAKWGAWSVAVGLSELRLSAPESTEISLQNDNFPEPKILDKGGYKQWYWRWDSLPAWTYAESTPAWYDTTPMMQASSYANWAEVAQWGEQLFESSPIDHPRLKPVIEKMKQSKNNYERIRHALDFVQNDIRYFGLELGENSHRPHSSNEVLEAGYGDCKDKTLLLINLLEHAGIPATPALVHSRLGPEINSRIPSPMWFDHVITHVQIGKKTLWLDATLDSQRGDVRSRSSANFHYALLLKPETKELTRVNPLDAKKIHVDVKEIVELGYPSDQTKMRVETIYSDFSATRMRRNLLSKGQKEVEREFSDYTRSLYRKAKSSQPMQVVEHPTENQLKIIEQYNITERTRWSEENTLEFDAHTFALFGQLPELKDPDRLEPQALNRPINVRHKAMYRYPVSVEYEGAPPEHVNKMSMPGIDFSRYESSVGDRILLVSQLQIGKDHISAKNFAAYESFKNEFDNETTANYGFSLGQGKERERLKRDLMKSLKALSEQETAQ